MDIQGHLGVRSESTTDTCTKLKTTAAISNVADETTQLRAKGEEQETGQACRPTKIMASHYLSQVKQ